METLFNRARRIKLALFDVDGVLTAGHIYFSSTGEQYKGFHTQDGLGIKLLISSGVDVGIISGHSSPAVEKRMRLLGVKFIYQGCQDKIPVYNALRDKLNLTDDDISYTGDDLPDLPLIQRSGLGIAVANARQPLPQMADWVTQKAGGDGAAREICELILQAQGTLQKTYAPYLNQAALTPKNETDKV